MVISKNSGEWEMKSNSGEPVGKIFFILGKDTEKR